MTLPETALAADEAAFAPAPEQTDVATAASAAPARKVRSIETRFGQVDISEDTIVHFKSGLLGFVDATEFSLIDVDNPKYEQFRILQCVNDPSLSFIVFPPSLENGLIDKADIAAAAKAVGFSLADLVVLLLVTVRRGQEGSSISLNLRAPVLVDTAKFEGTQHVLPNDKYPVRFTL